MGLFSPEKKVKRGNKTKKPKHAGSRFRDSRGIDGQVDDADNNNRRKNQSTDSSQ